MSDQLSEVDQPRTEAADRVVSWHIPAAEIEKMDEVQLRQVVIDLNEKVARLYDAMMLSVQAPQQATPAKPQDINHILNPEHIE